MGELFRSKDWSTTPLGPSESWPQSLRSALSICLGTRFPIAIYWGPKFVLLYNDMYSLIPGAKHPWALGRPAEEAWSEIWQTLDPMFNGVLKTGEAVYSEDALFPIDRNGYLEECYFNFTISPIRGESGRVEGLFNAVIETTYRHIGERRTRLLRELGARTTSARSPDEACSLAADSLCSVPADVPFCALYLIDKEGSGARLAGVAGIAAGGAATPPFVSLLDEAHAPWPFASVRFSGRTAIVTKLADRFGFALPGGPWPEPANSALVAGIVGPASRVMGFLVVGASPRRAVDDEYCQFVERAASQVASLVGSATAFEEERKRADALGEIDHAKTAFFSNVSHEFRTPLTLMLGPIEDALGSRDHLLSGEPLQMVHRNALRLMRLVNSLLDFSRIEAGRAQASYEPTELAGVTKDLASTFRPAIERAGLKLEVDCAELPEPIYVDREMWEKIVLNLLSNALKFTFEGSIQVSLRCHGERVELKVTDTGTGIPAHELPHLFARFHRVRGAKSRSHEGSGIGLALANELVKLHGGALDVASQPGQGATFTVSIPRGSAHLPKERIGTQHATTTKTAGAAPLVEEALRWSSGGDLPVELSASTPSPQVKAGPKPRVLVVEDNADLRAYITHLLSPNYEVEVAVDGVAALEAARARKPDLVLSDVMMPRLDGFGLLKALRGNAATHDVPIILLSARAGEESSIEGFEAGADDYVVKPFSARELLTRARTHLELARMRSKWAQELEQRSTELAAMNKELEAFCYSVSHDLRAPLRAINGFAEMLGEDYGDKLDDEGRRILQVIKNGGIRMGRLIDDLLAFSRLGRKPIAKSAIDMAALVRSAFDELHAKESGREIELTVQAIPPARADRAMIEQVWVNLLSNAMKYSRTRPKSVIEIGVRNGSKDPVYFIKDNGVGFDMEYVSKLFGVFQRLHDSATFEGTGVGLALVDRIVRRHGGRVWAEAAVDAGATFYFSLPDQKEAQDGAP